MTAARHTPTPWMEYRDGGLVFIRPAMVHGAAPIALCTSTNGVYEPEEVEANAALIVRAVNAHEALVEALAGVLALCMDPEDANESFERIGTAYQRATGHLRPGKDDRLSDSSSAANQERFAEWSRSEWSEAHAKARSALALAEGK